MEYKKGACENVQLSYVIKSNIEGEMWDKPITNQHYFFEERGSSIYNSQVTTTLKHPRTHRILVFLYLGGSMYVWFTESVCI